ncbi:hypothetical protein GCM10023346_31400 [Arthrobacter gyeryongensis]|uniref:Uncharacterized protein n=1 Tax=Arthrobacter gyeryongensis TaxID=1650592 RepID=A0ABP9SL81_9MICC
MIAALAADGAGDQTGTDQRQPKQRLAAGRDLGGRRQQFTKSQTQNARQLLDGGDPATPVVKDQMPLAVIEVRPGPRVS